MVAVEKGLRKKNPEALTCPVGLLESSESHSVVALCSLRPMGLPSVFSAHPDSSGRDDWVVAHFLRRYLPAQGTEPRSPTLQ